MTVRIEDLGDEARHVWLIGDDDECLLVDPPGGLDVAAAVGGRRVLAVVATDPAAGASGAALPGADGVPLLQRGRGLEHGAVLAVAGTDLHVLHVPGVHADATALYAPGLRTAFTGRTWGGRPGEAAPGAEGTLGHSVHEVLLALPPDTDLRGATGPVCTVEDARRLAG